jgi:hypothetical protein
VCPYSLDREELANYCYEVFKVRAEQVRTAENPACGRSLKTQQRNVYRFELDVDLGESGFPDGICHQRIQTPLE